MDGRNFFACHSKKNSRKQNGSPKNFFCDLKQSQLYSRTIFLQCFLREPLIDFLYLIGKRAVELPPHLMTLCSKTDK